MIEIDGAFGEGGGQVLRSSLCLSLLTKKPFRIKNIRGGRSRPGLLRQHLTAVSAAREVGLASVEGDTLGSDQITFVPVDIRAGEYAFSIGTAGSTGLVLQTILPALALADGPSSVDIKGGTHNPHSPPFDFLTRTLFPVLGEMGPKIEGVLHRPGFYPSGGGHARYRVVPVERLKSVHMLERGPIEERAICAYVANLPSSIAAREVTTVAEHLSWERSTGTVERLDDSTGPGNIVTVSIKSQTVTEVFTGFGRKGVSAERVAKKVAKEVEAYLAADVPVGPYLADQLLLWVALAGGGSFRTVLPTGHTNTHRAIIQEFLDVGISVERDRGAWTIKVGRTR